MNGFTGDCIHIDIEKTPELMYIQVYGGLLWTNGKDTQLTTRGGIIVLDGGIVRIGTSDEPITNNVEIIFTGDLDTPPFDLGSLIASVAGASLSNGFCK